eukprot:CAMPEP_0203861026 /NCGR_PEP_ID=MMETSP0359-20131031/12769_1 /ASSEMBLY_ACC=CAM_ASM_000338 /TAXON_ID=268821 /ORGANISM="Scrippsiella Hangoei, Strain SHTV-5" /LENGTH=159 /DNA_ID=CAMNT_0050778195 /DNA_START=450 /DNA_END=926 /DNA_ORIENTATION=+
MYAGTFGSSIFPTSIGADGAPAGKFTSTSERGPRPSPLPAPCLEIDSSSAGHRIQRSEGAELSTARGWRGGGGVPSGGRSSSKEKGGRTSLSGGTQVAVVMLCSAALRSAFPHAKPLKGLLLALDLLPPRTTPKVPAAASQPLHAAPAPESVAAAAAAT